MTTLAALAGTLPIALGWGAGAESRRGGGRAGGGGRRGSQLLTLYITPVFYLYMDPVTQWLSPKPVPEGEPGEAPVAAGS
jgi:HAE1 family hydrophobic/amphiphilic exporter-1